MKFRQDVKQHYLRCSDVTYLNLVQVFSLSLSVIVSIFGHSLAPFTSTKLIAVCRKATVVTVVR